MTPVLKTWWQSRSRREKALVVVSLLALLFGTIELTVLTPQRATKAQLQREIAAARVHLDRLRATAQELAARHAPQPLDAPLASRRANATAAIERAQVDLIAPQDMARQLAAILARHPQLRVIGMQSSAPKTVGAETPARAGATALYEHGLRIDVEGRYLDLLAYLEALEHAPYRIYWRVLDMKAETTPAVTRIELFTLSQEATWLRL